VNETAYKQRPQHYGQLNLSTTGKRFTFSSFNNVKFAYTEKKENTEAERQNPNLDTGRAVRAISTKYMSRPSAKN
jgi:hypothetical protein